jgi:hypothetical protein
MTNKQKSRKGRTTEITSFSAAPKEMAIAKAAAETAGFRYSFSSYLMHLVNRDIQERGVRDEIEKRIGKVTVSAMQWRSPFLQPVEA